MQDFEEMYAKYYPHIYAYVLKLCQNEETAEPYREVFWMRTFGELSFAEIGKVHDKTESWARVTYHRAKMKIMEELE